MKIIVDEHLRFLHRANCRAEVMFAQAKLSDTALADWAVAQNMPLVTRNSKDFIPLYALMLNHPGLIVLPSTKGHDRNEDAQQLFFANLVDTLRKRENTSLRDRLIVALPQGDFKEMMLTTATVGTPLGLASPQPLPVKQAIKAWTAGVYHLMSNHRAAKSRLTH